MFTFHFNEQLVLNSLKGISNDEEEKIKKSWESHWAVCYVITNFHNCVIFWFALAFIHSLEYANKASRHVLDNISFPTHMRYSQLHIESINRQLSERMRLNKPIIIFHSSVRSLLLWFNNKFFWLGFKYIYWSHLDFYDWKSSFLAIPWSFTILMNFMSFILLPRFY